MNILFIGNSMVWQTISKLPIALGLDNFNGKVEFIYVASGICYEFDKYFETPLQNPLPTRTYPSSTKSPYVWYQYENSNWIMNRMPNKSIKTIVESNNWDHIVLGIQHPAHKTSWSFEFSKPYLSSFINNLQKITSATIWYFRSPLPVRKCMKLDNSIDYYIGGKNALFNNDDDFKKHVDNEDFKIMQEFNLKDIPLRDVFKIVQKKLNSELMHDCGHVDHGIGRYSLLAITYWYLFNKLPKDFTFKLNSTYENDNKDIDLTKENKKIVDNIIKENYATRNNKK